MTHFLYPSSRRKFLASASLAVRRGYGRSRALDGICRLGKRNYDNI